MGTVENSGVCVVKILKEGTPAQWFGVVKCSGYGNGNYGCGAELEVEQDDLEHTYTSFMGRSETHYITIKCPCCGKHTDVDNVIAIPSKIYHTVMAKPIYVPE